MIVPLRRTGLKIIVLDSRFLVSRAIYRMALAVSYYLAGKPAAGAVTFQVRAWTDRYQVWAQLRSDLSVAVNDALAREKIAIA